MSTEINKKISVDNVIMDENGIILKTIKQYGSIIMEMEDTIEFLRDDWELEDEITIEELKERMVKNCLESKHVTNNEKDIRIIIDYILKDVKL